MRIGVLGLLEVRENGRVVELGSSRQRAVVARLVLRVGEAVSAERLIDDLWAGNPPPSAAKQLQGYVSQLRRVLPAGTIVTRGSAYLLTAETDAEEFERLLREADQQTPKEKATTLRGALALWRGAAYVDVEYEDWAQAEIGRLEELRLAALEERIDADLQLGQASQLVPELEALAAEHPLRERFRAQLMLALYRSGRQADALEVFADTRRTLVEQLGVEPGPELKDLQRRVLEQDRELGAAPHPLTRVTRRAPWIALAGAALLAAAAAAAGWQLTHRAGGRPVGGTLVALDPRSGESTDPIPSTQTPTALAVDPGSVWTLDTAGRTIERIDQRTHKVSATLTTGGTPTDLAVGAGALWIMNGRNSGAGGLAAVNVPASVSRLDVRSGVTTATLPLPTRSRLISFDRQPGVSALAIGRNAVWAIDASGNVDRIDPSRQRVVATVPGLAAQAIAAAGDKVWVDDGQSTVYRIDPRTNRVAARISLAASSLDGIALGDHAVWVSDPQDGTVWRIDPGPPLLERTVTVGIGVGALAYGAGALWAANAVLGTVSRIDAATGAVHTLRANGTPQAIAAGDGGAFASLNPVPQGKLQAGVQALPAPMCGPVISGGGRARFLIASDLPLRGSAAVTGPMTRAILFTLEQHHFRAGRYTIGYQSCDDSTSQSGNVDFALCGANGRAYAADPDLVGLIGPYDSGCAVAELPSTSSAPAGPLATIGFTTNPELTHRSQGSTPGLLKLLYPSRQRNFVRILAPDDLLGAAVAQLAHQLGLRKVYVLHDGQSYGRDLTGGFVHAAAKLRIGIAGVSAWSEQTGSYRGLIDRIQRSGATGVFLAGYSTPGTGQLLRQLRSGLGPRTPLIAGDGFLTIPDLIRLAGPAAHGIYISVAGLPNENLPATGLHFLNAFTHTQENTHTTAYSAVYAAQATDALLVAIARSDGTRASVTKQLFANPTRTGILGSFRFTSDGDMTPTPVTIYRIVGGQQPSTTYERDFAGSVIDRVVTTPASLAR